MLLQFPGRLDLVRERVGQASLCPSSWPKLLSAIERILPGASPQLRRIDRDVARRGLKLHRALSVANRTRLRYSDSGWQDDACHPSLEPGTIFRLGVDGDETRPDLMFEGETAGAGLVLHDRAQQSWSLTIALPPERREAMMPAVLTLLRRFADDLVDAFLVSHATGSPDQPSRETIDAAWDAVRAPVMLLDRELNIEAANVAAEDLLHAARYFRTGQSETGKPAGRLALASRDDLQALEVAVGRLLAGRRTSARIALEGLRGSEPLAVTLRRAGSPDWRRQFVPELAETNHVLAIFRPSETAAFVRRHPG